VNQSEATLENYGTVGSMRNNNGARRYTILAKNRPGDEAKINLTRQLCQSDLSCLLRLQIGDMPHTLKIGGGE